MSSPASVTAIVGTAGHIDHGKTLLVRALTGIDTDRLPEERKRGISIELGFAWMDVGNGERVGFVDVPGHERFIRQMLAGAQGFDVVLFVVAADDGVMPQTEEHFEICHLLGVRKAIFVVTKVDLASEARVAEVVEDLEVLAAGTAFEGAAVAAVSAATGVGIERVRALLVETVASVQRTRDAGPFRMPVDRTFVVKGHGVVVTGTAAGGTIAVGDEVAVQPVGARARVRELQVHEAGVPEGCSGQRVALNLVGVDPGSVARGDTIVAAGVDAVTDRFDARVEIRPSARKPVRSHTRVRVHVGTREAAGRIVWLGGRAEVEARASAYAQIVLREPAVAFAGERFVLRDETASRTLGGGVVVVARTRRHRRSEAEVTPLLASLEHGTSSERLLAFTRIVPDLGVEPARAAVELGLDPAAIDALAAQDPALRLLCDGHATFVAARDRVEAFRRDLLDAVSAHHAVQPSAPGIELEALRRRARPELEPRLLRAIVDELDAEGALSRRGSIVALPAHRPTMNEADEAAAVRVLHAIGGAGTMPPTFKHLEESEGLPARRLAEVVAVLVERGALVKVAPDLAFARDVLTDVEQRLRAHFAREREITAAGFRDLIGASRKYSIPLLDYFDRRGVTVRTGDARRLRES